MDYMIDLGIAYYPQVGIGLAILAVIYGGAKAIAKITPTKKDDKIVEKLEKAGIGKFLSRFNPLNKK